MRAPATNIVFGILVLAAISFFGRIQRGSFRTKGARRIGDEKRKLLVHGEDDEKRSAQSGPPDEFRLAHRESFGFFDDIPDPSWEFVKKRANRMPTNKDPENGMLDADKPERWYQQNWDPNFTCLHEERIGGLGDGGKWVCNPHRIAEISNSRVEEAGEKCLVYSVGSNGNFLFEEAIQQEIGMDTCEIHIFDPHDYSGTMPSNMFFHPWGIEAHEDKNKLPNFKSLQDTVAELGHEGRILDIFKIDCEGCEWRTYQDWFKSKVDIRQVLVETHFVPTNVNHFFATMRNEGFVIFHKEANTWSARGTCQEYAFMKLDESFFQESDK